MHDVRLHNRLLPGVMLHERATTIKPINMKKRQQGTLCLPFQTKHSRHHLFHEITSRTNTERSKTDTESLYLIPVLAVHDIGEGNLSLEHLPAVHKLH